jgi:hypothetical protein
LSFRVEDDNCINGVCPKAISESLGHESLAFTMDTYSHIIKDMQSDAIGLLNDVLPAGKDGTSQSSAKLSLILMLDKVYSLFLPCAPVAQMDRAAVS